MPPSLGTEGLVSRQRYPGQSTCPQRTPAEMSQPFLLGNISKYYILPQAAQPAFSVGNAWPWDASWKQFSRAGSPSLL